MATSEAYILAMAASFSKCIWLLSRYAARRISSSAASMRVAMSAILNWMAWNSEMGLPNCTRSLEYLIDSSRQHLAMPRAWDAMPIRPESSVVSICRKPDPGSPSMASLGMRASWNTSSEVPEPLIPSLSSTLPTEKPSVASRSMTNWVMPLYPLVLSVTAAITAYLAMLPLVMNFFSPLMIQWLLSSTALVFIPAGSLPALASVSP